MTPQRQSIFRALSGSTVHPTAESVYAVVSAEMPTISLRTVYQTLNDLAAMGELHSLDVGTGSTRFDPNLEPHHHLVCTGCGRIDDVYGEAPALDVPAGFEVTATEIVYRGRCAPCRTAPSPFPTTPRRRTRAWLSSRAPRPRTTSRRPSPARARRTAATSTSPRRRTSRATPTSPRCSAPSPKGETGHAFGHFDFLAEVGDPATGEPVGSTENNLKSAIAGETYEYTEMYPGFSKTAREEGFEEVAEWLETLARAEKSHAGSFSKALESI